jgi:endonuclease-3 related protein
LNKKIAKLYAKLRKKYGHPQGQWKLWCKRLKTLAEKEKVIIGAILTQRANWRNVELALANLKKANLISLKSIFQLNRGQTSVKLGVSRGLTSGKFLAAVKPSGFYKQKAEYLSGIAEFFFEIRRS